MSPRAEARGQPLGDARLIAGTHTDEHVLVAGHRRRAGSPAARQSGGTSSPAWPSIAQARTGDQTARRVRAQQARGLTGPEADERAFDSRLQAIVELPPCSR